MVNNSLPSVSISLGNKRKVINKFKLFVGAPISLQTNSLMPDVKNCKY